MSIFARSTSWPSAELAGAHAAKQVEALFSRPVAPRAVPAGLGQGAAVLANFLGTELVDVGLAGLDQPDRAIIKVLEVVRRMKEPVLPVEPEPANVGLDRVDEVLLLFQRIRVVEAQVAAPAELLGDAEIQADRHRMPDMQVAVRLGREARDDLGVLATREVLRDDRADEIPCRSCRPIQSFSSSPRTLSHSPRRCAGSYIPAAGNAASLSPSSATRYGHRSSHYRAPARRGHGVTVSTVSPRIFMTRFDFSHCFGS